jgi:hypothetical protein
MLRDRHKATEFVHLANVSGVTMSYICFHNTTDINIENITYATYFLKLLDKTHTSTPRKSANGIKAMSNDNMLLVWSVSK